MGELLTSLQIQWPLIVAQAVNFFLLLFILSKLVYKPLMRTIAERREVVEQSLQKAAEIEERMNQLQEYHKEQLTKAHEEAQAIISAARAQSDEEKQERLAKTQEEIAALFERTEKELAAQKDRMLQEAQRRMADMLIPALESILKNSLDEKLQQEVFKRSVEKVNELYQG